jgi:hypothetical protein
MNQYRLLKEGEVVLVTDEYYNDDRKQWVNPEGSVGHPAPNPCYTSHRVFRRALPPIPPEGTINMNFGQAIEALKMGRRVTRSGWNGRGMWLAMTPGTTIEAGIARSGAVKALADAEPVTQVVIQSHIDMRAADGTIVIGWLASQTDMLAEDWQVIAPENYSPETDWRHKAGFPRRSCLDLNTPEELVIRQAIGVVESMAAHPLLTDASVLLQAGLNKVADYIDLPTLRVAEGVPQTAEPVSHTLCGRERNSVSPGQVSNGTESKTPVVLLTDNDGHWYAVPYEHRKHFSEWVRCIESDDETWDGLNYDQFRFDSHPSCYVFLGVVHEDEFQTEQGKA